MSAIPPEALAILKRPANRKRFIAMIDARMQAIENERRLASRFETDKSERTNAELIAASRERCSTLKGFIREAWHVLEPSHEFVHGWHLDAVSEHLEAVSAGQINRLLINIPPGTMKSLMAGVIWPSWEWGPLGRPATRFLGSSYSEDYAKRDNRRMRDLITSEWFQERWPIELSRSGETEFANTATGFRKGVPFSRLTGGRGDRVIIDDPHSTEGAESEAERKAAVRIFTESVPTRVNSPEKSAIIVIMQRLHEKDVSGVILSRDLGYEHLMLPMEFDPDRARTTSIGFKDPRTERDELLFPERFPRHVVERDKKVMGSYAVAGQFQQRPAPRDGGLFKRGWFPVVDAIPASCGRRVRAWDFGATQGGGDATVGVRITRSPDGVFYVEHVIRDHLGPAGVQTLVKTIASTDPVGTSIRIPQDPAQAGKAQAMTFVKLLAGYDVIPVSPTGDKIVRARPAAAQAEAMNVRLLRGDWNEDFIEELCNFPSGADDDQVDAFADALNELALGDEEETLDGVLFDTTTFARANPWAIS